MALSVDGITINVMTKKDKQNDPELAKKPGRPSVPDDELQSVKLQVRMTKSERANLRKEAGKRGVSISEIVRSAVKDWLARN